MSLFRSLLGLEPTSQRDNFPNIDVNAWWQWIDAGGNAMSKSGQRINEDKTFQIAAAWAAVRVIAETIGSLSGPSLYRPTKGGGREEAEDEDVHWVARHAPNDETTSMSFYETLAIHAASWGDAYADLTQNRGQVRALYPIHPSRVEPKRKAGQLYYLIQPDPTVGGEVQIRFPGDILHLSVFSSDGISGMSPIRFHRETLGLALSQSEYAARLFSNGSMPRGVLEVDHALDEVSRKNLGESWNAAMATVENAHKTALLEDGVKFKSLSFNPDDTQFLESRKFQLEEIARIWRVPLHLLQDLSKSSFSNIEQQSLEFVIHTIRPWLVRFEQVLWRDLLTPQQKNAGLFFKFNEKALLRGAFKDQNEAFSVGIQNGFYSLNEVRRLQDMNPVEGGDVHLVPLNMVPLERVNDIVDKQVEPTPAPVIPAQPAADPPADTPKSGDKPAEDPKRSSLDPAADTLDAACLGLIQDALSRVAAKESAALIGALKKLKARDLETWAQKFYDEISLYYLRQVAPVATRVGQIYHGDAPVLHMPFAEPTARAYAAAGFAEIRSRITKLNADGAVRSWQEIVADLESYADTIHQGAEQQAAEILADVKTHKGKAA